MSTQSPSERRFTFPVADEQFRKSSYSNPGGLISTCVEVAQTPDGVAVRNSNDPTGVTTFYTHPEWTAFVRGVKNSEFDPR